jgi:signal transduction histidine kinase
LRWFEIRRISVLFAVATLLPIAALSWLGARTLEQDRDLERQRNRERLEVAAGRVAIDIEQDLQRIEAKLDEGDGVRFLSTGVVARPGEPLLFRPDLHSPAVTSSDRLIAAAQDEERNPAAAIATYQLIARSSSDVERGEALVALGGLLRRQRRFDEARRAYADLEQLGQLSVAGGQPAGLVARQGRAKTFLEAGDRPRLREEAVALAHSLRTGWPIDRASFEMYQHEMVEPWGGPAADPRDVERADAVAELWRIWRRGDLAAHGRLFVGAGVSTLAVWVAHPEGPIASFLTPEQLQARWRRAWDAEGLAVTVSRIDGQPVFGSNIRDVELPPAETRLPFVLAVAGGPASSAADQGRRRLIIGGITLACLLMIAASYGIYRVTTRELMLARQQADFVAAVSHEFRTPLTSMRHLLDLLITRGITDEQRKARYYGLLSGETDRLQRMVETLLSFGRIDAGAHVWELEPLDVADLVTDVAETFRGEFASRLLVIELEDTLPTIQADREALTRAMWNLLENAAKYSPGDSPVRLFARSQGRTITIGVEDRGIGIPVREQERVFEKFVRGDEAKRTGIRGVGVGLALVKRIAEGHGGSVRLTSEVGSGSTFMLVLPVLG